MLTLCLQRGQAHLVPWDHLHQAYKRCRLYNQRLQRHLRQSYIMVLRQKQA